jgi:hypothetical protein
MQTKYIVIVAYLVWALGVVLVAISYHSTDYPTDLHTTRLIVRRTYHENAMPILWIWTTMYACVNAVLAILSQR